MYANIMPLECKPWTHKQLPFKVLCRIGQKSFSKVVFRKADLLTSFLEWNH